jgi:outer membrane protein TolC
MIFSRKTHSLRHQMAGFGLILLALDPGAIADTMSQASPAMLPAERKNSPDSEPALSFAPHGELRLSELLTFAEENSPALKSAYANWEAAKERVPQAASLPDPRLTYGYFAESVQTRTGPQEQRVALAQTFPWFGKLSLKEQMALRAAQASFQDYLENRLTLARKIRQAFYEYAYLREAIRLNQQHRELLKVIESVAAARFRSGALPQSTLIQIQIEQGKLEDRTRELESLRVPLSSEIQANLGLADKAVLPWPDAIPATVPEIDARVLKDALLRQNPSLQKLDLLKERETAAVSLAEKERYPDITLGMEHITVDGGPNPVLATVSINLPLWRGRLRAAKREALNRQESITEARMDNELQLSARLDLAIHYYRDAKRKVSLYDKTLIPKAQQAIDVAVKGFASGNVNFADLLEAERTLLDFQLTGRRYLANLHQRLAEIEALAPTNPNEMGLPAK